MGGKFTARVQVELDTSGIQGQLDRIGKNSTIHLDDSSIKNAKTTVTHYGKAIDDVDTKTKKVKQTTKEFGDASQRATTSVTKGMKDTDSTVRKAGGAFTEISKKCPMLSSLPKSTDGSMLRIKRDLL